MASLSAFCSVSAALHENNKTSPCHSHASHTAALPLITYMLLLGLVIQNGACAKDSPSGGEHA